MFIKTLNQGHFINNLLKFVKSLEVFRILNLFYGMYLFKGIFTLIMGKNLNLFVYLTVFFPDNNFSLLFVLLIKLVIFFCSTNSYHNKY